MLMIGQQVDVRDSMTGKRAYLARVLRVSKTGLRVTIGHPRYVSEQAVFYRDGASSTYRESCGGVSALNDWFTAVPQKDNAS